MTAQPERTAPLLTPAEVAKRLNTTIRHVYRLIHRKRYPLPARAIGHYFRIDEDELLAWWRNQPQEVRR